MRAERQDGAAPPPLVAPSDPFTDQQPGVVATPARLHDWAAAAKSGDRFVYATLCALPPRSPGAAAARILAERGLVALTQRATGATSATGARVFNYFAQRTSRPWPSVRPRLRLAGEPDIVAEVEAIAVERVLPVLDRAAQFARPCPTNRQLAARVGCAEEIVPAALEALRSLRFIYVQVAPLPTGRFVTILATGARTGIAA